MRYPIRTLSLIAAAVALTAAPLPGQTDAAPAGPAPAAAQQREPALAVPAAEPTVQEPLTGTPEAAAAITGLPARAAPPRTLRAYWHVFIAFALVWALLFGYALSLGRRFARLETEVRRLEAH